MATGEGHPFDQAVALVSGDAGDFHGQTHPAWANMIGPYGGITAAQALNAILLHPQRLGDPVAYTINFAAALADGEFVVRPRAVRTNRSSQHWTLAVLQGEDVVATGTAVTALRRETWEGHEAEMPEAPRPQDVPRTPPSRLEWLHRYDMRLLEGGIPRAWNGEESEDSLTRMWARDDPPRPLDFGSLTAAADIFFPRIFLRRAKFTPIGTVSMTVYFHATAEALQATGDGFLLLQARGQGFGGGFFDHSGQLWNEAGVLLATTHQVVYFKE